MTKIEGATRSNNLDGIRLILAGLVIHSHSYAVAEGHHDREPMFWYAKGMISAGSFSVAMFFVLSGFLICRSWERSRSLTDYLLRRAKRIVPGYAVAALVTICVLLAFRLPWDALVAIARQLAFGEPTVHPAAFHDNPYPRSPNGSLWTVRYEAWCYLGLAVLGMAGLLRRRLSVLLLCILLAFAALIVDRTGYQHPIRGFGDLGRWASLGFYFLVGCCFHLYRNDLPTSPWVALIAAILFGALLPIGDGFVTIVATGVGAGYLTIWMGTVAPSVISWTSKWGDPSYGTYLYGFLFQQTIQAMWKTLGPWGNFAIAMPASLLAGMLSWHLVEKWFLQQRLHSTSPLVSLSDQLAVGTPARH